MKLRTIILTSQSLIILGQEEEMRQLYCVHLVERAQRYYPNDLRISLAVPVTNSGHSSLFISGVKTRPVTGQ